jgi:hypothetical protein
VPWPGRSDLEPVASESGVRLFRIPDAASRAFTRPDPDHIEIRASSPSVHVLESYDPGWSAEVDGSPAPIHEASGLGMDIPVPAGDHLVRLTYRTPGRTTGIILSLVSLALLAMLV